MHIRPLKIIVILLLLTGTGAFFNPINAQRSVGIHFAAGESISLAPLKVGNERNYYSVAPGFGYQQVISSKWSLFAGVGLLSTGKVFNDTHTWPSEHDGSGGYMPDPTLPHKSETRIFQLFSNVQLGAKYYLNQSKIRLFLQPYIEGDIFLSNRSTRVFLLDNGDVYEKISISEARPPKRKFVFSTGFGFGGEMDIGDQFVIFAVPDLKFMTSDVGTTVKATSLIIALKMGVWYKL
jgi:hypothetical protein